MRRGNKVSIMAHNMLIQSQVIKTHLKLDLFLKMFFSYKSSLNLRGGKMYVILNVCLKCMDARTLRDG